MILNIDTSDKQVIKISLEKDGLTIIKKNIVANRNQSEKLLPAIDSLLKKSRKSLKDIKKIAVGNSGDSFTALRIGVLTANALAYALGIEVTTISNKNKRCIKNLNKFKIVIPDYKRDPDITLQK